MRSVIMRLLVCVVVCVAERPLFAINRSWDDQGNDAGKNWSDAGEWSPDGVPQSVDDIFIGNLANAQNDTTLLDLNFTIGSLTLSNGAEVDTSGNRLIINGPLTLGGSGTTFRLRPFSTPTTRGLDVEGITVNADGALRLVGETGSINGGILELESGLFQINGGGEAGGHGTIQLINSATVGQALENSGRLFVSGRPSNIILQSLPGTLTITRGASGTGTIDLDGDSDDGVVDVDDGGLIGATSLTLVIDMPLADSFSGQMDIGNGDTVNIIPSWQMVAAGGSDPTVLNFNGSGTHTLTGGTLTVSGAATQINANAGTTVIENNLTVNDGDVNVAVDATLQLNATTTFAAAADLSLNASGTHLVVNGATTVNQATFNWDGTGNSTTTVNANASFTIDSTNIDIDPAGMDIFDGTIQMNSGDVSVTVGDGSWQMDGTVHMANTANSTPLLSGSSVVIGANDGVQARLNVTGAGNSQISAAVTFLSDARVDVAAGSTLVLSNSTTFNSVNGSDNAAFIGEGILRLDGSSNDVNETTTVNMPSGRIDLDGTGVIAQTLTVGNGILENDDLTLNVSAIDSGDNSFGKNNAIGSDTIVLNGFSDLIVNLTDPNLRWTLNPNAVLDINAVGGALAGGGISGSGFNMGGVANISGNSIWNALTSIAGTANLSAGSSLNLRGGDLVNTNRIEGGIINGPGILRSLSDEGLTGFGTIHADVDFANNTILAATDGTLTLNGAIVDVGTIGTAEGNGVLNVANAWNTNVANVTVELQGGRIEGATITNDLAAGINGRGEVSAAIVNNTRIDAEGGGTLRLTNAANNWDGSTNTGSLRAISGNLELADTAQFLFHGTVSVEPTREVFANGFELEFDSDSNLNLDEGTYRSTNTTDFRGAINVEAGADSTIDIEFNRFLDLEATSVTTLTGNLRLVSNNAIIRAGATFSGAGALIVPAASHLTADASASIDVLLDMQGTFRPAGFNTVGRVDVSDYQQAATGALVIEVAGTALNQFDRLVVNGSVILNGTLDVDLEGGFVPALGNTFTIITAVGGVSGKFSTFDRPILPPGRAFSLVYNPSNVVLTVVPTPSTDFNNDGDVDADDLAHFISCALGPEIPQNDPACADARLDDDDDVDSDDYGLFQACFSGKDQAADANCLN